MTSKVAPALLEQPLTQGSAQATTSGTFKDFPDIPAWATRITMVFAGVSLSGTSDLLVQLGDAGGIENSGYAGTWWYGGSTITSATLSAGFVAGRLAAAANLVHGTLELTKLDGNTWVARGSASLSNTAGNSFVNGSKTLSETLTQVRLTTVNGTDTFDAGSVNILYE